MVESKKGDKVKAPKNTQKKPSKTGTSSPQNSTDVNQNHNSKKVSLGPNTKR